MIQIECSNLFALIKRCQKSAALKIVVLILMKFMQLSLKKKAKEQASRCSQCGVPFCQTNCPLHNNIPDWLMLTAEGRMEESLGSFFCNQFIP